MFDTEDQTHDGTDQRAPPPHDSDTIALPAATPIDEDQAETSPPAAHRATMDATAKRTAANRFAILNAFADRTMQALSPGEIKVWLLLFRDARPPYWIARAGQANLARRAGYRHVRDVGRAIANLQEKGLLQVARRGTKHAGVSSHRVAGTIGHFSRRQSD